MEYRSLGRTGVKVSELCLGTMQFGWTADEGTSFEVLTAAYEAGINFIDTADVYTRRVETDYGGIAEALLGRWMKQRNIPRHAIILATKVRGRVGPLPNDAGLSRVHILKAVEDSLRRLQTDYIDLYQAHSFDPDVPIEETLEAFDLLVRQGKVRYIGASNYPAWRLMQALWASDRLGVARYDCLQPHYNLVHREEFERELMEVCETYRLGVIPYSPLAAGFLTGKYTREKRDAGSIRKVSRYFHEHNFALLDTMAEMARENGRSISQIALAWLLTRPVITSPIIGPRSLEQLQDNLGAAGFRLSAEEMALLDEKSRSPERAPAAS
ncbi:MAG TPA: aldo/keto reductase [Chloroflexi bacterium]|nr:aldo/keto reductase [Chloroflexota bacterium]